MSASEGDGVMFELSLFTFPLPLSLGVKDQLLNPLPVFIDKLMFERDYTRSILVYGVNKY